MPLKVIFLFTMLLLCSGLRAQHHETDSLESLVLSVPADTNKVTLLNKLVISLREKNNNMALAYGNEAVRLAEHLAYNEGLKEALENLGWILYRRGDYTKAFEISTRALKIAEGLDDRGAMARCLISIAAISYEQKKFEHSLADFRRAYQLSRAIDEPEIMARSLNNIAYLYVQLNILDSALYYVRKSLGISEQLSDEYFAAFSRRTLGDIYLINKEHDKALENFVICLNVAEELGNNFLKVSTLHRLGKVHQLSGNYDEALSYFMENIELANEFGYREELERTYKLVSENYAASKNIAKAFEYQSKYLVIHDSLTDQRQSEQMALMEASFNTERKEAQIALLTKEAELNEKEIHSQKIWRYFLIGCLSLLMVLAFVLLYNNRYTRIAKKELEEKNVAIQTQAEELRNLNATKDKLFSIISHDLRSPLASLKALMELVGTPGLTQEEFVHITRMLKRNLDCVHDDLDNLLLWAQTQLKGLQAVPEPLGLKLLADEKIGVLQELANVKKISISNNIEPDAVVFADRNHVSLVLRNLIGNAIKFNRTGGSIVLSSKSLGDQHEVSVSDSGVGIGAEDLHKLFNPETHFSTPGTNKERGAGIGLLLTREFIENNHGTIKVDSEPGKGTTFTFTLRSSRQLVLV